MLSVSRNHKWERFSLKLWAQQGFISKNLSSHHHKLELPTLDIVIIALLEKPAKSLSQKIMKLWVFFKFYRISREFQNFLSQLTELPHHSTTHEKPEISIYIDKNTKTEDYLIPVDVLEKRFQVLDICTLDSTNSNCFTKSYSRYLEGTGSVFCNMNRNELNLQLKSIESNSQPKSSLQLRFFTPKEVSRLMSFPATFSFPSDVNEKQQYKLLGNSINVAVVSELIKLLFNEKMTI